MDIAHLSEQTISAVRRPRTRTRQTLRVVDLKDVPAFFRALERTQKVVLGIATFVVASSVVGLVFLFSGNVGVANAILLPVGIPFFLAAVASVVKVGWHAEHRPVLPRGSVLAVRLGAFARWMGGAVLITVGAIVGSMLASTGSTATNLEEYAKALGAAILLPTEVAAILGIVVLFLTFSSDMCRLGRSGRLTASAPLRGRGERRTSVITQTVADLASPASTIIAGFASASIVLLAGEWLRALL